MLEGHISRAFDGALATLHVNVLEMGGLVLDQVREAVRAFTDWNPEAARRILQREAGVAAYAQRLGDEQLALLALRQPVARDLRAVIALARVVAELERGGEEARKIALTVLRADARPWPSTARDARHLGQLAVNLLRLALEALDHIDGQLAAEVIAGDEELDAEYASGLRRLLTRALENPRHLDVTVEAAFALKSLERIGDHARNIGRHLQGIGAADISSAPLELPAASR